MNRIVKAGVTALGALILTGGLTTVTGPAQAGDPDEFAGSVTSAPDNGCPAWARDTFERTTTVTKIGKIDHHTYKYEIHQRIDGTWISETNPDIHGTLKGYVEYTVTGKLRWDAEDVVDDVDLSSVDCKENNAAPDTTGTWALRYFKDGATAGSITNWEYMYDTACEEPVMENADSKPVSGSTFTQVCPPDLPSPSPDPSVSPSSPPEPTPTASATPGAGGTGGGDEDSGKPELAVTGAPLPVYLGIGAGLLGLGSGLFWLTRRRTRVNFTA